MTGQTGQTDNGQIAYTANRFTNGRPKTAEPIEMPYGFWTWVGPMKHVLDGVQIVMQRRDFFMGKDMPGHTRRPSVVSCAKTAEPFRFWARVGSRNNVLDEMRFRSPVRRSNF